MTLTKMMINKWCDLNKVNWTKLELDNIDYYRPSFMGGESLLLTW